VEQVFSESLVVSIQHLYQTLLFTHYLIRVNPRVGGLRQLRNPEIRSTAFTDALVMVIVCKSVPNARNASVTILRALDPLKSFATASAILALVSPTCPIGSKNVQSLLSFFWWGHPLRSNFWRIQHLVNEPIRRCRKQPVRNRLTVLCTCSNFNTLSMPESLPATGPLKAQESNRQPPLFAASILA
jgi:hypothetical protein